MNSEIQEFLKGRVILHGGDCLDVLRAMPESSIDSCVTDPPYALVSITKRFGKPGAAECKVPEGGSGAYARASAGFMGKAWDTGERAFSVEFWAEVYRVLKPGGHVLAFGGTRTVHRLTCAIEDAGFEIRDMVAWLYGSGFPKSHDVSKGIDRAAGAEREVIGRAKGKGGENLNALARVGAGDASDAKGCGAYGQGAKQKTIDIPVTASATDAARQWEGWGTALKPALEPVTVARKPLEGTVAQNVQAHSTGALNIDGCRVGWPGGKAPEIGTPGWGGPAKKLSAVPGQDAQTVERTPPSTLGRWPANVTHDGSDEVMAAFQETSSGTLTPDMDVKASSGWSGGSRADRVKSTFTANAGSAARFFYNAKADAEDRAGSKHPTVKPVDLMRWLVRLVTPPGGTVLDPFAGTGTTGEAAWREGFSAILVEREQEYREDTARRMDLVLRGPEERKRAIAKAKGKATDQDFAGTLFGESAK